MAQCLGENVFHYAIFPHQGNEDNYEIFKEADRFNLPLIAGQAGFGEGWLPKSLSFFEIDPEDIVLSSLKKSEGDDTISIRLYNPTTEEISGKINCFADIKSAHFTNLNEEIVDSVKPAFCGKIINVCIPGKKIITLAIHCKRENKNISLSF